VFQWTIEDEADGERVDKYLSGRFSEWSRTLIQQWLKEGRVTINGETVKASRRVSAEDEISLQVPPPREVNIEAEPMDLDIRYEDGDLLVVNKPRGLVVHPAPGHYRGTLVNGLLAHCDDLSGINGIMRPGIVHRIDKETSGLLMVAKHDAAHRALAQQLQAHTVKRIYTALVNGMIHHQTGTVDAPIGRDPKNRQRMAVVENGKQAVTHFAVQGYYEDQRGNPYTMLNCRLETGRTHQIRVHMAYIGHPLVGDPVYASKPKLPMEGQALHAGLLGFIHPRSREYMEFHAELPDDMTGLIAGLKPLES
jgi:23S rRNA pseudouridine1911/1915/1917 synthase